MKTYLDVSVEEIEELKERLIKILRVWEHYPELMDETIDHVANVVGACSDFIRYRPLVDTQADKDTFGEFLRRTERSYEIIKNLNNDI